MTTLTRRRFLTALTGAAGLTLTAGLPGRALAFGEQNLVDIAELDLGDGTLSRPSAWKRLLYEMVQTTSVDTKVRSARVTPEDPALFEHPFLVLLGDGAFAPVSEEGIKQLSQFLAYGGFLFIDDTTGREDSGFDKSVRRMLTRLFPTRPLSFLPEEHSLFRSYFLLREYPGRVNRFPQPEGVSVGNLTPVVYSRNDVSGALMRDELGQPIHACVPGGEAQRREAVKVGINMLMYSLTANYKADQAHVKALMERGHLE